MNTRIKKTFSLTFEILRSLLDASEGALAAVSFDTPRGHIQRQIRRNIHRWRYNQSVKQLIKNQQLELVEKNGKLFLKLTRKGKLKVLLERLGSDFRKEMKWDGKWRVIIWDIPEASRKQRDRIRWFVKNLGFFRLQHSVFITPNPLPASAVAYLNASGLDKFIRFLRVDQIDNDRGLKNHFLIKNPIH